MAIINLTRKTFTKAAMDLLDGMGMEGLITSTLLGGKEKMKERLAEVPDENLVWVNTDHVVAASGLIKAAETGDVVFRLYFSHPSKEDNNFIWILGSDYERFIKTWTGGLEVLMPGEYDVPEGCMAISVENGTKVVVDKIEEVTGR